MIMKSRLKKIGAGIGAITVAGSLAVQTVGGFEGLKLYAYRDVVGVWTACYGETAGIKSGMRFSVADCNNMLIESIVKHEAGMRACLKNPDAIPEKAYVAFVSLTYNIGIGQKATAIRKGSGFCGSTARKRVDAGDLRGACDAILSWNKGGRPLREIKGLTIRRHAERKLCLEGIRG